VENFPGFPEGIDANELMDNMRAQAERFGCKFILSTVERTDFSASPYRLWLDDGSEIEADSVIIATGASAKYLGLSDEQKYMGMGVSACATCDGFFYRKKVVAVVGGGDTACEEANYLSGLASKVYLIVRKPFLRASQIMQDRVLNNEKIEVLFETNTLGLYGEDGVEGARLIYKKGEPEEKTYDLPIDGFFLAIGHRPNSEVFRPWIETDETGYIKTIPGTPRTSLPGIFAAGDVADPHYRQAIIAAGSGAQAAMEAEKYLSTLE
jgi:thioredoxin reductase (NADPH)